MIYGRNHKEIRKLINTVNYVYATGSYLSQQAKTKRPFVILDERAKRISPTRDNKQVFVLVLGEAARKADFSLYGYERETNPLLSKQDIVVFKNVVSCGTATAISVPCIFSHLSRRDFKVEDASRIENLLDLLKRGGYDVLWLENDNGCKRVCNRVENKELIDLNYPEYCFDGYCQDEAVLIELKKKLDHITTDTVIVLHTMGSHGPAYFNRYPERFKKFLPTCDTTDLQRCSREALLNTYDNTILFTDYILDRSIEMLKRKSDYETALIYVSDHGESLGEKNIYLHSLPYKIAPKEQKEIPMIMWMSEKMQKGSAVDYRCLKTNAEENAYSHDNIFHSVLGLLGVETHTYRQDLDVFDSCRMKDGAE